MKSTPILHSAVVVCALLLSATSAGAIEIEEVQWGFDGKVIQNRFNLVSIAISNPTPNAFEGTLVLRRTFRGGERRGARLVENVYLGPYEPKRWVQFYPYILNDHEEWVLTWNRGRNRFKLVPQQQFSREGPARVMLVDSNSLVVRGGNLKQFDELLFPPMVTATDGLHSVVLDHVPRWQEPRRRAFLDWLNRGGRVHVLHDSEGDYPKFPAALSELNSPLEKNRVGAGIVYRHPRSRREIDRKFRDTVIFGKDADGEQQAAATAGNQSANKMPNMQNYSLDNWENDSAFFSNLKQFTRPDHNWILIHLMSWVYIGMIFAGALILGRRTGDYKVTYGAILGTIALFSMGFHFVGRRGYGEATAVNAVAITRPIADGQLDVMQWTNTFVTDGDFYLINHAGTGRLYSTCQDLEAVNGSIDNGAGAGFLVDIPPFSSRSFGHRSKLKTKPFRIRVKDWQAGERLDMLTLSVGAAFPKSPKEMYVLYRDSLYRLGRKGDQLSVQGRVASLPGFLREDNLNQYRYQGPFSQYEEKTPEARYSEMFQPLLARDLGIQHQQALRTFSLPANQVRLYIYTEMPKDFYTRYADGNENELFGKQSGYVLYSIDVYNPEAP